MKKKDLNKMRMYDQVVLIISEHDAVWQTNVPFAETYSTFSQRVTGLKEYIETQYALMGTHSIRKREAKEQLIAEALRIEKLFRFFAAKTENAPLLHKVKHTATLWKRSKEVTRVALAAQLEGLLEEHLNELEDYGLAQEDLDSLQEKLAAYEETLSQPRNVIVHRAAITQGIREAMVELDAILKLQVDNFVHSLASTQPEFVKLYKRARNVINYKGKGSLGETENEEEDGE